MTYIMINDQYKYFSKNNYIQQLSKKYTYTIFCQNALEPKLFIFYVITLYIPYTYMIFSYTFLFIFERRQKLWSKIKGITKLINYR